MIPRASRELTGQKVFLIGLGLFLVMLTPNIILAVMASRTFSGLVVPNSYVASQDFDLRRAAQDALGWDVTLEHSDDVLRLALNDRAGHAVRPAALMVTVGRPTSRRDDTIVELVATPGGFAAPLDLAPGAWRVEIVAEAADGTLFQQSRALHNVKRP